ncbi:hypothetical protein PHMEG_00014054 [Phytophthora megakarya]|uniref:Reverse transcriptase RNase H-like domain-containing protein n=1 Tax=Phytophthora megakarya TaxID=4795 RepID=A0A225W7C6_9STRA|nr:hypothetical protein PHMEG_00014054 [Phytophthora megakarya]
MMPLAHPSPRAEVCLYTDDSQVFWGALVRQLESHELDLPMEKQNQRSLAFLSGRFTGAAVRWLAIDKEAFAIIEAMRRLEYLPLRSKEVVLSLLSFRYLIENVPEELVSMYNAEICTWGGLRFKTGCSSAGPSWEEVYFVWPAEFHIRGLRQAA